MSPKEPLTFRHPQRQIRTSDAPIHHSRVPVRCSFSKLLLLVDLSRFARQQHLLHFHNLVCELREITRLLFSQNQHSSPISFRTRSLEKFMFLQLTLSFPLHVELTDSAYSPTTATDAQRQGDSAHERRRQCVVGGATLERPINNTLQRHHWNSITTTLISSTVSSLVLSLFHSSDGQTTGGNFFRRLPPPQPVMYHQ